MPDRTQQMQKMGDDEAEDLQEKPTGVDTSGTNLASTVRNFLSLFDIAGVVGDSEDDTLVFDLNFLLPFQDVEKNLQLRGIVDTEPELFEPLKMKLPEAERDDLIEKLDAEIGGFDDFSFELTYNLINARAGRSFEKYRRRFESLVSPLEEKARNQANLTKALDLARVIQELDSHIPADLSVDLEKQSFLTMFTDEEKRLEFKDAFESTARELGRYNQLLAKGIELNGLKHFADLVNNQPQFYLSLKHKSRDDLTGPDEASLKVTWEKGFVNLNTFYKSDEGKPCMEGVDENKRTGDIAAGKLDECLKGFRSYVTNTRRQKKMEQANRAMFSLEYSDIDDLTIPLPNDLEPVSFPGSEKVVASAGFGRLLKLTDKDEPLTRVDFMASYEYMSDSDFKDRAVASLTLTRKLGALTIPFGIVWANRPEFLPEVDHEISAHVGLRFSMPGKKKEPSD